MLADFLFKAGRRHNRTRRPTSVAPSGRPFWEPNLIRGLGLKHVGGLKADEQELVPTVRRSIQNLGVHVNAGDAWNAKFQIAFQLGHHLMRFPERRLSGEFSFERDYQSLIGH